MPGKLWKNINCFALFFYNYHGDLLSQVLFPPEKLVGNGKKALSGQRSLLSHLKNGYKMIIKVTTIQTHRDFLSMPSVGNPELGFSQLLFSRTITSFFSSPLNSQSPFYFVTSFPYSQTAYSLSTVYRSVFRSTAQADCGNLREGLRNPMRG